MNRRIWLVRHGSTDWSEQGRFTGWADLPLNAEGRRQAESLGARMDRGDAVIWSSDLRRAVETATLAFGPPRADPRVREIDFGRLEGLTWEECDDRTRAELLAFEGFRAPGGESVADLRRRARSFLQELPRGRHVVVTHGGVIRALTGDVVGLGGVVEVDD